MVWRESVVARFGRFDARHEIGNSLEQTRDDIIVLVSHDGPSYLLALDKSTGQVHWKADRPSAIAWSSPVVVDTPAGSRIYVSANGADEAYDVPTGRMLWTIHGLNGNTVLSPTIIGQHLLIGSSDHASTIAIAVRDQPDQSHTPIAVRAWQVTRASSRFGSPLASQGNAYFVNKAGVLRCHDQVAGDELWLHRPPGGVWISPVAAGSRLYFFGLQGMTTAIDANAEEPVELAHNTLDVAGDRLYGAALVDGAIILRTSNELIRIGAE